MEFIDGFFSIFSLYLFGRWAAFVIIFVVFPITCGALFLLFTVPIKRGAAFKDERTQRD